MLVGCCTMPKTPLAAPLTDVEDKSTASLAGGKNVVAQAEGSDLINSAVNDVSAYIPGTQGKAALEQRKREFVKYSKRFSNTLKEYFKEGQPTAVFTSATYLIYQTNQVMITVKNKCE